MIPYHFLIPFIRAKKIVELHTPVSPNVRTPSLSGYSDVDISYAGSRIPRSCALSGLGDYSPSAITGFIDRIIADQKARVGRFFTYQSVLIGLRDRALAIKATDSRGTQLVARIDAALKAQTAYEAAGMKLLTDAANIKSQPIIQLLLNKNINYSLISAEQVQRGDQLIGSLSNMLTQSAALNKNVDAHEKTVNAIKSDVARIEGELSGRSTILGTAQKILGVPVSMMKYGAIIAAVAAAIYFIPRGKRA
jgi:hypothetical protein